jgi:HK97 family phage prohead protease
MNTSPAAKIAADIETVVIESPAVVIAAPADAAVPAVAVVEAAPVVAPLVVIDGAPAVIVHSEADVSAKALTDLIGKAVFFGSGGERVAGKVARAEHGKLILNLAVPNSSGLLCITDTEIAVKASEIEITKALMDQRRVAMFEVGADLKLMPDQKVLTIFEQDEAGKNTTQICDYQNVVIEGHASTFGTVDKRDRGGDYVIPGAWDLTLPEFRRNPVMLVDHENEVDAVAGSWSKVSVDGVGLGVIGNVSNAPGLRDLRFKLMEGHVKGLSIGGIWYYGNDGYGIEEAELFEISIVAVPMNPETLAHTRKLAETDCRKAFAKFWQRNSALRTEPILGTESKP